MKIKDKPENFYLGTLSEEIPRRVKKYLGKYISGRWKLEYAGEKRFNNAVIIPAIGEFKNLRIQLTSLISADNKYFNKTIFIFIINNPASSVSDIKEDNKKSLSMLRNIMLGNRENKFVSEVIKSGLRVAVIDACTNGNELPENTAGVGHARKIGMDLALTVFDYNNNSKNILVCLDADCTVEKNYLTEIVDNFNRKNISAAVIKYRHSVSDDIEIQKAITCYEIFLYYYELGLKYAESPYAFHTVGSTIACDSESYIKVEGMNKKKAGEDFYFLEKLLKNSKVEKINTTEVHPAPRKSWRVPFGTGKRITRFLSRIQNEYILYNPESFYILKNWLAIFLYGTELDAGEYLEAAYKIDNKLGKFLEKENFISSFEKISSNSPGKEQRYKQKVRWFDGFRTLKLIHFLRDNGYPLVNMFDALDNLFGKIGISGPSRNGQDIPETDIQKEYLTILRQELI